MATYKKALGAADLAQGQAATVTIDGTEVAVFNIEGNFYALANQCPHRGGPLGDGDLTGDVVTCPWHGWEWNVTTGENAGNPDVKVKSYPVRVENGEVLVCLEV